jgi:ribosome-associated toxin RatA of RatAB toxin-antitoxin module
MRHSVNEILIGAPPPAVMRLAFDLPAWPSFLPHYRWVTVLKDEGESQVVEMACRRSGIPLKWRSRLWVRRAQGTMRFLHLAGPARGMDVEWEVRPSGRSSRVTIRHALSLEVPVIRTTLGRWVVGELFVGAVAGRTLACLKEAVERGEILAGEAKGAGA